MKNIPPPPPYIKQSWTPQQKQGNSQFSEDKPGFGIASFVFGIIGIFFWFSFFIPILGIIFGLVGIKSSKKKLTIAGLVMSIIELTLFVLIFASRVGWKKFFEGFKQGTEKALIEERVELEMNKLNNLADYYRWSHDNYYEGFDLDPSVLRVKKNIESYGGKNFFIAATKGKHCAKVNIDKDEWYCIDSGMNSGDYFYGSMGEEPKCSVNYYLCR